MVKKTLFTVSLALMLLSCSSRRDQSEENNGAQPKSMIAQVENNAEAKKALKSLMEKSDCAACHQIEKKSIGPSYMDVAQKYENTPEVINALAEKIIKGSKGVWGQVPMTPHPNMSKEDAEALAKDIMALKQ